MNKTDSGTANRGSPDLMGGDQACKAEEWGGGSKAAKGPITEPDRHNRNSSQKRS
ncbi:MULTISPECIES: hypothetical protein [unclassified Mesorhizobium]|uniref:hypothetical protein n=1 Tax=unclassified Mesorhizobium TaxID=325217 RepID=UPI0003CFDABC|nr:MULTISPECIES: hypothetical protein [unclassified Mesorhizobium]ESZ34663.1 hypothetical protein X733_09045 [Mesorhizobium sp. L2C067A000]ESZ62912.1 hypothetical protein X729_08495 [Mesorhizobium sp. L103C131B0]ESZ73590.1 hypothetical protein X727_02025 [Mesorhizobium sp. L103C119B0]